MEKGGGGAKAAAAAAAAAGRSNEERENKSLYNALRSIYEDSVFVGEICEQYPQLPLLANLPTAGHWYSPNFHSTCCFRSKQGRTNLHLAHLAGQKGGCIIVDSTCREKCYPDSLSKIIPTWTCLLNRAISNFRRDLITHAASQKNLDNGSIEIARGDVSCDWDCSLRLPPAWVSYKEEASLAACLKKPLRTPPLD